MGDTHDRRAVLRALLGHSACVLASASASFTAAAQQPAPPATAEQWLEEALSTKSMGAPLRMSRFVEPIYFLLAPGIGWTPNPDNGPGYKPINVPAGFVTDLASIPPVLFPVLRADGDYAQAAIVHDYLYWTQRTTRQYADEVFRVAMRDLEVKPAVVAAVHAAVHRFGQSSWDRNATLKREGERRFLKREPQRAATRWEQWKRDADNFYAQDL